MTRSKTTPYSTEFLIPTAQQITQITQLSPLNHQTNDQSSDPIYAQSRNLPASTSYGRFEHRAFIVNDRHCSHLPKAISDEGHRHRTSENTAFGSSNVVSALTDEAIAQRLQSQYAREYVRRSRRQLNSSGPHPLDSSSSTAPVAIINPVSNSSLILANPETNLENRRADRQPRRRSSSSVDFLPSLSTAFTSPLQQQPQEHLRQSRRLTRRRSSGCIETIDFCAKGEGHKPSAVVSESQQSHHPIRRRSSGCVEPTPPSELEVIPYLGGADYHQSASHRIATNCKADTERLATTEARTSQGASSKAFKRKKIQTEGQVQQLKQLTRRRSSGCIETVDFCAKGEGQKPTLAVLESQQSHRPVRRRSSSCVEPTTPSKFDVNANSLGVGRDRSAFHRVVTKAETEALATTGTRLSNARSSRNFKRQSSRLLKSGAKTTSVPSRDSCLVPGSSRLEASTKKAMTRHHGHRDSGSNTEGHRTKRSHDNHHHSRNGSHHGMNSHSKTAAAHRPMSPKPTRSRNSSPVPTRSRNASPLPTRGNESGLKIKGESNLVYQVPLRRNDDAFADSGHRSPVPAQSRLHNAHPHGQIRSAASGESNGQPSPRSRDIHPSSVTPHTMRPDTPGARTSTTIQTTDAVAPIPHPRQVQRNTVLSKEESMRLDEEYARQIQQQLTDEDMARRLDAEERVAAAAVTSSHRASADQTRNNNNGIVPDVVACVPGQGLGGTRRHQPPLSSNHAHRDNRGPARAMAKPSVNHVKSEACCQRVMSKSFSLVLCLGLFIVCGVVLYVVLTGNDVDIPGTDISVQDITDVFMHDPWEYGPQGEQEQTYWKTAGNKGLTLKVFNALSPDWYPYFYTSIDDWDNGSPDALTLNTQEIKFDPNCEAIGGSMKVCNGNYGETGWKGVNEVLITAAGVITVSVAKMNEFYLTANSAVADKQYTMCHEMGHGFGLNHADENFNNRDLGTCMDYTNRPANNMTPNQDSYQILASLYGLVSGGIYTPPTTSSSSSAAVPTSDTTLTSTTTTELQPSDNKKDKNKGRIRGRRELADDSVTGVSIELVFDEDSDYHPKNHGRLLTPSFGSSQESFFEDEQRNLVTSPTRNDAPILSTRQSSWKLVHRQRGRELHIRDLDHGFKVLAHVLLSEEEAEKK